VDAANYASKETLRDGRSVTIRSLRPEDREAFLAAVDDVSVSFSDLKASLAVVFTERNRYVHEFSRLIADSIGETHDNERFTLVLEHVYLLLRLFQNMKMGQYGGLYTLRAHTLERN
jgi:hypothetical protein